MLVQRCMKGVKTLISNDVDDGPAKALGEFYNSLHHGKDGVVFAHTNACAGFKLSTALAQNDVAGNDNFAAKFLNAQAFAMASLL